jgi:alpha-beta hydrolase superfamily lysophospholipase
LTVRTFLAAITVCSLLALFCIPRTYSQAKERQGVAKVRGTFPLQKFYDTPSPLPTGKPGELIRSQEFDQYDLPLRALAVRILYHSRSAAGQDIASSGVVLYPDGKPPAGGWPVIAWAHAFNGVARQCAPSLARNLQHGPFLSMYLNLGYAVVMTDYAGLGSSVRNAFTDVQSNAADVIYSVPAARSAVPQVGARWVAIGIGEGGLTAIGVAELEHDDPNYLGSVVISGLEDLEEVYQGASAPYPRPLLLAYGIKTVYPEFDVKEILTEKALVLYPRVENSCSDPMVESKLTSAEMLKPDWASNKFVRQYFSRNTPGKKPAQAPLLVISSELDPREPIGRTAQIIARMCKQADQVQFDRYPQSQPTSVFGDSVRDQISWIQARFAGRRGTRNCSE